MIEIIPLTQLGEIEPRADLPAQIVMALEAQGAALRTGDVLVLSQKIVSKAEDRFVDLNTVHPGARARDLAGRVGKDARLVELVLRESSEIIRAAGRVLITRHRTGHVMANAGIDQSNLGRIERDLVLLLPLDSDASADRLRAALSDRYEAALGVIVADSFGRPWRQGVVNVAIGASGLPALLDRRGHPDRDGRALEVTQIGFADMVASAAGLVLGEAAEGVPAAIVRGLGWSEPERPAAALLRPIDEDLFR